MQLQELTKYLGGLVVPVVIIVLAIVFLLTIKFIASRYKKIPPTRAGVFYGRKYKVKIGNTVEERGFLVVLGGGRVLMPLVESYQEMSTEPFQVEINEENIPNKDNVPFVIRGVATCKISTIPEDLYQAAGAFLGKSQEDIKKFIGNILKGHLRSIVGKLDINALLRERDNFNSQVIAESKAELANLGIDLRNLVIQDITDSLGYIDALGRQAVAETKSTADIAVSNAELKASQTKAQNEGLVAEAERDRDIKKAEAKVTADTKLAIANNALGIATAAQQEILKVAEAKRDAAEKTAQIGVQKAEAERVEQEQIATVVRPAEAQKQRVILEAEAQAEVKKVNAAAKKEADTLEGEGEAAKVEANLMAQARGNAAQKREALVAEAEGTEKLAAALREMNDAARLIILLEKLPPLLGQSGDALAKVAQAIFSSVAAPLGQIDNISIVDVGGSGRGLDQMSQIVPNTVFKFLAAAKAQGIDFGAMLGKLGIDPTKALSMLSGVSSPNGSADVPIIPAPSAAPAAAPTVAVPPAPAVPQES